MSNHWIQRELVLIRHGQTSYNLERRMQGHLDIPLNETGRLQAQACARMLTTLEWDVRPEAIISSDLSRASETAANVGEALGLSIEKDVRLRELMLGDWQGLTIDQAATLSQSGVDPTIDAPLSRPNNAEPIDHVAERARAILDEVAWRSTSTILVSHGGTLQIILCLLLGLDVSHRRQFSFGSASVTRFAFGENGQPVLLQFGLQAHY